MDFLLARGAYDVTGVALVDNRRKCIIEALELWHRTDREYSWR